MKQRRAELGVERIGAVAIAAVGLAALAVVAVVAPAVRESSQHEHATAAGAGSGQTRVYYVAADNVRWDYAPRAAT